MDLSPAADGSTPTGEIPPSEVELTKELVDTEPVFVESVDAPVLGSSASKRKCNEDSDSSDELGLDLKRNRQDEPDLFVVEQAQESEKNASAEMSDDDSECKSDISHHTAVLGGDEERDSHDGSDSESESGFGLFEPLTAAEKKRRNELLESQVMTSNSEKERERVSDCDSVPTRLKDIVRNRLSTFADGNTAAIESTGSGLSHSTSRGGPHRTTPQSSTRLGLSQTVTKPTFCQFPVIIQDKRESESACLFSLKWKLADILMTAVGSVRTIKYLSKTKVVVGCQNVKQQQRLLQMTNLGGLPMDFKVPTQSVDGVIFGIPTDVSEDALLSKIECILNEDDEEVNIQVKHVSRLTFKDGITSQSVKLTFEATKLPSSVIINRLEYCVRPFVAQVIRCYKCQKLGHVKKDCIAKRECCSNCGSKDHKRDKCDSSKSRCLNCGGEHSAAYLGCPRRKALSLANKIRSQSYMPRSQAIQQAKKVLSERSAQHDDKSLAHQAPVPNSAWKAEHQPVVKRSYAAVTSTSSGSPSRRNPGSASHRKVTEIPSLSKIGDGPSVSRISPGDGPGVSRLSPGDGPGVSRLSPEDGPGVSRLSSGDGPGVSRFSPGDRPGVSWFSSEDGLAVSRFSSDNGGSVSRSPVSTENPRSISLNEVVVNVKKENYVLKKENDLLREELTKIKADMQLQNDRFLQEIKLLKSELLHQRSSANNQPSSSFTCNAPQVDKGSPIPPMAVDPNLIGLIQHVVLGVMRNMPIYSQISSVNPQ